MAARFQTIAGKGLERDIDGSQFTDRRAGRQLDRLDIAFESLEGRLECGVR